MARAAGPQVPAWVRAQIEAPHATMKPSSIAEPRSLQQWLPDIVFGFENLASHKLRSLLTMLGMIFGVAAAVEMRPTGAAAAQKGMALIRPPRRRQLTAG